MDYYYIWIIDFPTVYYTIVYIYPDLIYLF